MATYQEKLAAAKVAVNDEATWTAFEEKLKKAGGTDNDALKECSYEDLQEFGLPRLTAKKVAKIFREEEKKDAEKKPATLVIVSAARAQAMTPVQLADHYDPSNVNNAVAEEMRKRAQNRPCLIFNPDGTFNADATAKVIQEAIDGFPARTTYRIGDKIVKVYPVGGRPGMMADENPLYPGRILRPDGSCDLTGRSWARMPYNVRVLERLAVESGELPVQRIDQAHTAIDLAELSEFNTLCQRWQKAALRYQELEQRGELPKLKAELNGGNAENGSRPKSPFAIEGGNRRY